MLHIYYAIIALFAFLFATSIGSFLNVVIYRLPNGLNVANGRSFCPKCETTIRKRDLIPILSYLLLGGKCHNCKEPISPRYPIIELITGLAGLLLCYYTGFSYSAISLFVLFCLLLCVTMIDIDTMTIPDSLQVALAILAVPYVLISATAPLPHLSLLAHGIGFFAVSLPMFLLCLAVPNAFGGGDIKLMAVCGFLLGYQNILLAMFLGCVLGGMYAIYLLRIKPIKKGAEMCFGPFLSVGIFISALFGAQIISWYFGLF